MNDLAISINALAPLAVELRDRQELIESKLKDWHGITADLVHEASEQGGTIILAKQKLAGRIRWSEWLQAHVPNLSIEQAAKYERVRVEQLKDPRQCIFAFLPPPERAHVERMKPAMWETAWGYISKLSKVTNNDLTTWPKEQLDLTEHALEDQLKRVREAKAIVI